MLATRSLPNRPEQPSNPAFYRRLLPEQGPLAVFFMTLMLLSVVWSLQAAEWVDDLGLLNWVVLAGIFTGLVLASTRFSRLLLHLLSVCLGIEVITFLALRTLPTGSFEDRVIQLVQRIGDWHRSVTTGGLGTDNLVFLMILAAVGWTLGYLGGWTLSRSSGVWWVMLGAGTGMIVNLSYAHYLLMYFFFFLFCAILLAVRLNTFEQERYWRAAGISYNRGLIWRMLSNTAFASVGIVAITWNMPLMAGAAPLAENLGVFEGPLQEAQNEFNRLFGAVRSSGSSTISGYGPTLALKGPVSLSNAVVLYLWSDKQPRYLRGMVYERYTGEGWVPGTERTKVELPAYDEEKEKEKKSDERRNYGIDYALREDLVQHIKLVQPKGNLVFAAGQPVKMSLATNAEVDQRNERSRVRIDLRQNPVEKLPTELGGVVGEIKDIVGNPEVKESTLKSIPSGGRLPPFMVAAVVARMTRQADVTGIWMNGEELSAVELVAKGTSFGDVAVLRAPGGIRKSQTYSVTSSVSTADAESLRHAGTDYPSWINERYRALPTTVPPRVRDLAREITRGKDSPYDRAIAIEAFLRRLTYNEQIPPPPVGKDAVEYFLFESKQGYCDYYSSAMAVMLRAVGVPARVVAGYNIGDYDPASGVYTVREANSHAWTEVFFPGYGWLEFEPTPSRPAFDRPETPEQSPEQPGDLGDIPPIESFLPDDAPIEDPGAGMGEGYVSDSDYASVLSLLQWTITLAVVGVIGFFALGYYWRRSLQGLTPSQRPYAKVARVASWLGRPQRPSETPAEYVDWLGRLIPGYRQSLALLGASFTRAQFGRQALPVAELLRLNDAWHDVRVALVKALAARWIAQRLPPRPRWLQVRS